MSTVLYYFFVHSCCFVFITIIIIILFHIILNYSQSCLCDQSCKQQLSSSYDHLCENQSEL